MAGRADTVRRTLEFCRKYGHTPGKAEVWVPPIAGWKMLETAARSALDEIGRALEGGTLGNARSAQRILTAGLGELKRRGPGVRRDLYGFVDVVCLDDGPGTLYLQTTTPSNHASHVRKMAEEPLRSIVLRAIQKNRVAIVLWSRQPVRLKSGGIGKAVRWTPRFVMFDGWTGPDDTGLFDTTTTDLPYGWSAMS